jgi:biopolymer transport protein ExbD
MAFGTFNDGGSQQPMSEINVTPLVDVMLVLLIIFIITAPLLTHGIKIDLPRASSSAAPEKPETITLSLDAEGRPYWNGKALGDAELPDMMSAAAKQQPQPELHLRADRATRYQKLAEIMSMARNAGIARMGFVTDPTSVEQAR